MRGSEGGGSFVGILRRSPIVCYLLVTFAVTWSAWIPLTEPRSLGGGGVTVGFSPRYLLGLLGPMVGALVATAIVDGWPGVRGLLRRMVRIGAGAKWWGIAFFLPLGVAVIWYAVTSLAGPAPRLDPFGRFNGLPVTSIPALWLWLLLINGFGEETGWRGFLLPRLQEKGSPLRASLLVAGVWAIWHVPAFWVTETYRLMPVETIPLFLLGLVSGSVFLTWLYNGGRASILLVAVWHATFNLLSGTVGARGALGAIETAVVMVVASILVVRGVRRPRSGTSAEADRFSPQPAWR